MINCDKEPSRAQPRQSSTPMLVTRRTYQRASRPYTPRSEPAATPAPIGLRKQLPEPVFGQIKQARGFRQFLLRGIESVRVEWAIVCTVHNLLKLALAKRSSGGSVFIVVSSQSCALDNISPICLQFAGSAGSAGSAGCRECREFVTPFTHARGFNFRAAEIT